MKLFSFGLAVGCCSPDAEAQEAAVATSFSQPASVSPMLASTYRRGPFLSRSRRSGGSTLRSRRFERRFGRSPTLVRRVNMDFPRYFSRGTGQSRAPSSHSLLTAEPNAPVLLPTSGLSPGTGVSATTEPPGDVSPSPSTRSRSSTHGPGMAQDLRAKPVPDATPVAVPIANKPGYARLTGRYSGFPEIDVRGIAPGTPVEIPDPDTPGARIRFRVPELRPPSKE